MMSISKSAYCSITMLLAGCGLASVVITYACGMPEDLLFTLGILNTATLVLVAPTKGMRNRDAGIAPMPVPTTAPGTRRVIGGDTLAASMSACVTEILSRNDALFRELAAIQLDLVSNELRSMASGQLFFAGSESWRTAYERILRSPGLGRYLSVAWLRTEDYWRDAPGRRSIRLNYDLAELGLRIERIVILNDFFWAPGALLPAKPVLSWLVDQHKHGIGLRLVRESEIEAETDLLGDFGIYGDRAVGRLDLDDQCRSLRFTLDFNPQGLRLAEEQWRQLELFAVSFREVLDRGAQGR